MINNDMKKDKEPVPEQETKKETSYIDTARMDVNCHILIKDKDTGEILLNKRG